MNVQLFVPCFIDQLYPQTAANAIKVLEFAGCRVRYNPFQTCCGQPAFNSGFWDEAKTVASKFINDFTTDEPVISLSGSCKGMVLNYYNDLFTNTLQHNKCRTIQSNMFELSEFLVNKIHFFDFGAKLAARAVYHDSCGALRECGIRQEPRELLRMVQGLDLVEAQDSEVCCGFGGTFAVKFEAISTAMAQQKIDNALALGAEYILSVDTSCLMHIQGYIDKHNLPLKTMHLADVLATNLQDAYRAVEH